MNQKQIRADDPYNIGFHKERHIPVWGILETVILLLAIFFAFSAYGKAEEVKLKDGWQKFEGLTAAYDPVMNYIGYREVIVLVSPLQKADGYPVPPVLDIRSLEVNLHFVDVPPGEVCLPSAAPVYHESGGGFFFPFEECRP